MMSPRQNNDASFSGRTIDIGPARFFYLVWKEMRRGEQKHFSALDNRLDGPAKLLRLVVVVSFIFLLLCGRAAKGINLRIDGLETKKNKRKSLMLNV
jgi:hypothetical protein